FSVLRALIAELHNSLASRLALVGAFGYDLLFRFDPIDLKLPREGVNDLRLFLCDDIYFMDRKKEQIERFRFDFTRGGETTRGVPRTAGRLRPSRRSQQSPIVSDHETHEYMANVQSVRDGMRRGDYYEVVLRQTFSAPYTDSPSELFERIQRASPSP